MRDRLHERFENDPLWRAIVQQLYNLIATHEMAPSELREAAMYAAIRYDMLNPQPMGMRRLADGTLEALDRPWLSR